MSRYRPAYLDPEGTRRTRGGWLPAAWRRAPYPINEPEVAR